MSTISHDIVPLPYLPEGGGFICSSFDCEEPLSCYFDTRDRQNISDMWAGGGWGHNQWYGQWQQGGGW